MNLFFLLPFFRYISSQLEKQMRIVALGASMANAKDLARDAFINQV